MWNSVGYSGASLGEEEQNASCLLLQVTLAMMAQILMILLVRAVSQKDR